MNNNDSDVFCFFNLSGERCRLTNEQHHALCYVTPSNEMTLNFHFHHFVGDNININNNNNNKNTMFLNMNNNEQLYFC